MIPTNDHFWDVRAHEQAEEQTFRAHKDRLERSIAFGQKTLHLKAAPGYADFVKAVEHCHLAASRQLLLAALTNEELREARGRARALEDVLAILTKTEQSVGALEEQLAEMQNAEAEMLRRRPKRPEPAR